MFDCDFKRKIQISTFEMFLFNEWQTVSFTSVSLIHTVWVELRFHITVNNISVIHVAAHGCADGLKKFHLLRGIKDSQNMHYIYIRTKNLRKFISFYHPKITGTGLKRKTSVAERLSPAVSSSNRECTVLTKSRQRNVSRWYISRPRKMEPLKKS